MGQVPSRLLLPLLFGVALIMAAGAGWLLARYATARPPVEPQAHGPLTRPVNTQVHLYFGDNQGRHLSAETRIMQLPVDPARQGRQLVQALLDGPQGDSDGTAYVDLVPAVLNGYPKGVESELLSIYSIVNTLVLNVDAIRSVKLLIGGQNAATLAGHVDLRHAFRADMLWIR